MNPATKKPVRAIVLTGNGTNCEMEMAHGCRLGGADVVDIVHISSLMEGEVSLADYDFLNLPGGFLDGDDMGAARASANRFKYRKIRGTNRVLLDEILQFIEDGKLVFGVCNGFQLLVKMGLLPGFSQGERLAQVVTLSHNDSGRFEDRWVSLEINPSSPCVFTREMDRIYLPVRHGEGKFYPQSDGVLQEIKEKNLHVMAYCDPVTGRPTDEYPFNPNGSIEAIAALTDETGRVFGMMPHPEAFLHRTNHPRWTREDLPEEGNGVRFFKNAVDYLRGRN
ncbi:MAG: phosphoribosylformylglycinamidine synthase subunit PurQ [Deltaproteobacteria bacterium]|nr:MAG: phosphoribosylformylglycinamidine synthase subunit PurQ [Deltaproteobacteria bacterium]